MSTSVVMKPSKAKLVLRPGSFRRCHSPFIRADFSGCWVLCGNGTSLAGATSGSQSDVSASDSSRVSGEELAAFLRFFLGFLGGFSFRTSLRRFFSKDFSLARALSFSRSFLFFAFLSSAASACDGLAGLGLGTSLGNGGGKLSLATGAGKAADPSSMVTTSVILPRAAASLSRCAHAAASKGDGFTLSCTSSTCTSSSHAASTSSRLAGSIALLLDDEPCCTRSSSPRTPCSWAVSASARLARTTRALMASSA
mmetsp:Transcript_62127/g.148175  ORF Transcript_62127/g.148175 Transcript_62127/m.148175 type:complete len:254 (-) Transcript_62127:1112-1873(-)